MRRNTRNFEWGRSKGGGFYLTDKRTGMTVYFDGANVTGHYEEDVLLERHCSSPGWKAGSLPEDELPCELLDDLEHIEKEGELASADSLGKEVSA